MNPNLPMMPRIFHHVIDALVTNDQLELAEFATVRALTEAMVARVAVAPPHSQLGKWLSDELLRSPLVEELYATDEELIEVLSWVFQG